MKRLEVWGGGGGCFLYFFLIYLGFLKSGAPKGIKRNEVIRETGGELVCVWWEEVRLNLDSPRNVSSGKINRSRVNLFGGTNIYFGERLGWCSGGDAAVRRSGEERSPGPRLPPPRSAPPSLGLGQLVSNLWRERI